MNWDRLSLVSGPQSLPVDLDSAKAHLNVNHARDDQLITQCIRRAVSAIDGPDGIGRCLITQSWLLSLDCFPRCEIVIPLGPVASITSIKHLDASGLEQTVSAGDYWPSLKVEPAFVRPAYGMSWPAHRIMPGSVKVEFVAGKAASMVPESLKAAILFLVGHYYANREAVVTDATATELPLGVQSILSSYRAGVVA